VTVLCLCNLTAAKKVKKARESVARSRAAPRTAPISESTIDVCPPDLILKRYILF